MRSKVWATLIEFFKYDVRNSALCIPLIYGRLAYTCQEMGVTKIHLYEEKTVFLASQLKSLAHPARLEIMHLIHSGNVKTCIEFSKKIGLHHTTISQHLTSLKCNNFISSTVINNEAIYFIDYEVLMNFNNILNLNVIELIAG